MGKRKTAIEQLESLNKKQEQMKAQEKLLKQRIAEENRKARTKRLIQIGAEVESVYEKLIRLRKFLQEQEFRGAFLTKALERKDDDNDSLIRT